MKLVRLSMDKRKEHKRLLDLEYPTRQDMRECMWLGKEIIEQLEQEIVNYENTSSNSDYAKCITCADDLMNMLYEGNQNGLIRHAIEKIIVKHFA